MQIEYVTTQEQVEEALGKLKPIKKICLDYETTGLDARIALPRLLQLCSTDEADTDRTVFVFDLFKIPDIEELKTYVETREMLVGHNLNFDFQFNLKLGIDFKNKIFDTYIAERCLRAGFKEKKISPQAKKPYFADLSCSLKAVVERRLEEEIDKEQRLTDWSQENLTEEQIAYAAKDVDILPRVAASQLAELIEESLLEVYTLESKCIRPVALMCHRGFGVDITKLKELRQTIETELDKTTQRFCEALDEQLPSNLKLPKLEDGAIAIGKKPKKEFNPGSNTQCLKYFSVLNVDVPLNSATGKPTLNQVALAEFDSDDPLLNLYRKRVKTETRLEHVNKLISNINPVSHRIHSGYNQYGANSGRFTSSGAKQTTSKVQKSVFGVNIQQVPRSSEFRGCFVPTLGFKFVICDFSQIELRLGAELIGIPQMIKAFQDGEDLHQVTASLIYKVPVDAVTYSQRQDGKTLNFALLYGMGFRKYKTYAAQSGKVITLSEAKIAHTAFHTAYPRLRQWHRERAAMVEEGWCYVRTPIGRRRLLSYDDAQMMACANTLIQGAGADILKLSIARLGEYLNDDAYLIACVHDEIVMEVKEGKEEHYKNILEGCMKEAAETILKTVPSKADASVGDTWADK
jgi:DNA polymerase I-like protein with 3'-5' exonuclease and polymerase domains